MESEIPYWRKCSSCKKSIGFLRPYFVCSVSTCNGQRTGYVFCSFPCFEVHLPSARHKQAGAIEKTSPAQSDVTESNLGDQREPQRKIIRAAAPMTSSSATASTAHTEVLIIASRLKDYIAAKSDYNTSGSVMDVLSNHVRRVCDEAIDHARADGRKTVLDRDFDFLKKIRLD